MNRSQPTTESTPEIAQTGRKPKRKAKREFCVPRVSFRRLVQEIMDDRRSDLRIQGVALDALQEAAETMLSERFARCSELADICKLDTVRGEHWRFVQETGGVPCSGMS